jgi:hypothetical protein
MSGISAFPAIGVRPLIFLEQLLLTYFLAACQAALFFVICL